MISLLKLINLPTLGRGREMLGIIFIVKLLTDSISSPLLLAEVTINVPSRISRHFCSLGKLILICMSHAVVYARIWPLLPAPLTCQIRCSTLRKRCCPLSINDFDIIISRRVWFCSCITLDFDTWQTRAFRDSVRHADSAQPLRFKIITNVYFENEQNRTKNKVFLNILTPAPPSGLFGKLS